MLLMLLIRASLGRWLSREGAPNDTAYSSWIAALTVSGASHEPTSLSIGSVHTPRGQRRPAAAARSRFVRLLAPSRLLRLAARRCGQSRSTRRARRRRGLPICCVWTKTRARGNSSAWSAGLRVARRLRGRLGGPAEEGGRIGRPEGGVWDRPWQADAVELLWLSRRPPAVGDPLKRQESWQSRGREREEPAPGWHGWETLESALVTISRRYRAVRMSHSHT